jgi:hypothetical protein
VGLLDRFKRRGAEASPRVAVIGLDGVGLRPPLRAQPVPVDVGAREVVRDVAHVLEARVEGLQRLGAAGVRGRRGDAEDRGGERQGAQEAGENRHGSSGRWNAPTIGSHLCSQLPGSKTTSRRSESAASRQHKGLPGFGRAVICGLAQMTGDAVVIMMADESDDCRDVVQYWEKLNEGYDAVFGSRFVKGGGVIDYPWLKLRVNPCANLFVRLPFGIQLNDTTNAFKAYRRTTLEGCRPFLSPHFNLTVELPLKTIVRGYSWTVIPITWKNRRVGESKLKIKEMGSRYLFSWLHVWLEKHLTHGDYHRR